MSKNSYNRLRKISLVPAIALLALAAAGPARAADLSVAPLYKAPPVVAPPAYNWSGFYVGLNGGGGRGAPHLGGARRLYPPWRGRRGPPARPWLKGRPPPGC